MEGGTEGQRDRGRDGGTRGRQRDREGQREGWRDAVGARGGRAGQPRVLRVPHGAPAKAGRRRHRVVPHLWRPPARVLPAAAAVGGGDPPCQEARRVPERVLLPPARHRRQGRVVLEEDGHAPVPGVGLERGVLLCDEGLGVAEARGAEAERVGDGQQDERGGHGAPRGHPVDAPVLRQEGGEGRGWPLAVVRRSVEVAARSLLGVARRALREVARHRPGRIEHRPRGPPHHGVVRDLAARDAVAVQRARRVGPRAEVAGAQRGQEVR